MLTYNERKYRYLVDTGVATEDEIDLVMEINGASDSTLEDILYARLGYHSFDQLGDFDDYEY